jgi:diguanylate cyclase (GGDEF)-like protein
MLTTVSERVAGVLPARRSDDAEHGSLRVLAATVPLLREELVDRARTAGLIVAWIGLIAMPAWTVVDRLTVPEQAADFLVVRLAGELPMLAALIALRWLPLGRRRPELLTFVVLLTVQLEIAWMISRTTDAPYHLLGFTLAVYGSGCIMVARPRWTVALVAASGIALAGFGRTAEAAMSRADLVAVVVFMGTAAVIAVAAHLRRHALTRSEVITRVRLEREQQRTGVLLAQLERLSNEDPLTGVANRRRWDAELASACTVARFDGDPVAVLLLDIDRFKTVNDRHGHGGGDTALREVAGLLRTRVRDGDLVARLGGDELAVLVPGADLGRAVALAEELRAGVTGLQPQGFAPGELSLSIGVAALAGGEAYPMELMSRADAQLYRAKITRNAVGAPSVPTGSPAR